MIRNKLPMVAMALVLMLSVFSGVGMAAQNADFNGTTADTADQTDTVYVDEGTEELNNVTIEMTENQSVSAGGSVTFDTAYTASDATIVTSSGSGTLEVTVNSGTVVVSETGGSSSATLEELQVQFDVVNSTDKDGIPAIESEVMNSSAELVSDNDNSEIHSYYIYDAEDILDVSYEFSNGNYTDGAYDPESLENSTDMTVDLTRNGTTHENVPLEYANVTLEFDTSYMENVSDVTNTTGVTRTDKVSAGDTEKYVYSIDSPDATTENDTYALDFTFDPTSNTGEDAITVTEDVDPAGGLAAEHVTNIDFGSSDGSGLSFYDSANVPIEIVGFGGILLVIGLGALVRYRGESMGISNLWGLAAFDGAMGLFASLLLFIPGILMIIDTIAGTSPLPVLGMELNLFTDLVTGFGLPSVSPLFIGGFLVAIFVYVNREFALN